MLNDFATAPSPKMAAEILSLLRMPFRQGALREVFQAVFHFFEEPFAKAGVAWG